MDWAVYRKLIVAGVGLLILVVKQAFDIDVGAWFGAAPVVDEAGNLVATGVDKLVDAVIAILTAVGVWAAPNKQPSS